VYVVLHPMQLRLQFPLPLKQRAHALCDSDRITLCAVCVALLPDVTVCVCVCASVTLWGAQWLREGFRGEGLGFRF
jgi:hypothetical protein